MCFIFSAIIIFHHVLARSLSLSQNSDFSNQFKSLVGLHFLLFPLPFNIFFFSFMYYIFRRCFNIHLFLCAISFAFFSFFSFSVHGPFNSNVLARSPFSPISRSRRIRPAHVPAIKRPTVRDITSSAVKKIPFYMDKFPEPFLSSDKIMFSVYKKKRRIISRSN